MVEIEDVIIDAPVDDVWATITTVEHIGKWFAEADHEIDELKPGGLMTFHFKQGSTMHARIVEVEPNRAFAYRIFASLADEPSADSDATFLRFTLAGEGDKTRLRMEESNSSLHRIKKVAESL